MRRRVIEKKKKKLFTKGVTAAIIIATLIGGSGAYIINRQIDYAYDTISSVSELPTINDQFVDKCVQSKVNKVILISDGNSESNGYSKKDTCIPYVYRMTDLTEKLESNRIKCIRYNFSRMQNNSDWHTYEKLENGMTQSEINQENRIDYLSKEVNPDYKYMSKDDIDKYYPINVKDDKSIKEIINNNNPNTLVLIIYHGFTGDILDNATRGSEESLNDSFARSLDAFTAYCHDIQISNIKNNAHTQILVCGIADFNNLGLTDSLNNQIKKIADSFPNTIYVESSAENLLGINSDGLIIDPHRSNIEYNADICNVTKGALNFNGVNLCIDLDGATRGLNKEIEFNNRSLADKEEVIKTVIDSVIEKYNMMNIDNSEMIYGIKKFMYIFKKDHGYEYAYINKEMMEAILDNYILQFKEPSLAKK